MVKGKPKGSLRASTTQAIFAVLEQGESLRDCLPKYQNEYSEKDKAWMQEMVFGVLRKVPLLQYWLRKMLQKPLKGKNKVLEHLLMLGFYQIAFSRVPSHAAVSESVDATHKLGSSALKGVVNGVLRNFIRENVQQDTPQDAHIQAGLPKWLYKKLSHNYGDNLSDLLAGMQQKPPLWLRVNNTQISRDNYLQQLNASGVTDTNPATVFESHPNAILLEKSTNVALLPGFDEGWFSVQDGAAQLAAQYLDVQENDAVLDACCAPGGKTCHIIESQPKLKNCIAIDNDSKRLVRVEENLSRLKLKAEVICADVADIDEWWDGSLFDKILLDAPCSATGVIRRHPDILWLRKPKDIEALTNIQASILNSLWKTLKPGGTLLYATCSILPDENQIQIAEFLRHHSDARLQPLIANDSPEQPGRQILPGEQQMDGFYYARLLKSN